MIHLPPVPQRTWLRCFWASGCLLGVGVAGFVGLLLDVTMGWSVAAMVGIVFAAGMFWPRLVAWPYRAWDRLARVYADVAKALLMRIAFYMVCVPVGYLGSGASILSPPQHGTRWTARNNHDGAPQQSSGRGSVDGSRRGWIARYAAWARQSGEAWRSALLPFMILLSAIGTQEQESSPPDDLYTLF